MASKVPVISTNTGGLSEVNIHGKTGYLSNVGDIDDMAANSLSLLTNANELNKFKNQAFEQAKTFDIEHILPMYEKLYAKVLQHSLVH
jgi:glycosyltransferase involved in cell wall biosynthesis